MSSLKVANHETLQFPLKVGEPVEVYRDPYTIIRRQSAEFEGFRKDFYMWDRGVRAAIIPFWNGKILVTLQYRFLVNQITSEIPGGKVEPGEDPKDAAIRECFEETGVRCLNAEKLIFYHPGLDTYHNPTTVFFSMELAEPLPKPFGKFLWVELGAAIDRIFSGKINDSLSIIGLLALHNRLSHQG